MAQKKKRCLTDDDDFEGDGELVTREQNPPSATEINITPFTITYKGPAPKTKAKRRCKTTTDLDDGTWAMEEAMEEAMKQNVSVDGLRLYSATSSLESFENFLHLSRSVTCVGYGCYEN